MYLYIMAPYKTKFEMLYNWNQSYIFKKLTDNGIVAIFPLNTIYPYHICIKKSSCPKFLLTCLKPLFSIFLVVGGFLFVSRPHRLQK